MTERHIIRQRCIGYQRIAGDLASIIETEYSDGTKGYIIVYTDRAGMTITTPETDQMPRTDIKQEEAGS